MKQRFPKEHIIEPSKQPEAGVAARDLCRQCAHYYITHDQRFRYGCRALDFKSQRQPILDVVDASSFTCLYFQAKAKKLG